MPWPQVQESDSLLQVLLACTAYLEHLIGAVLVQRPAAVADLPPMAPVVAAAAACTSLQGLLLVCHASGNTLAISLMSHVQSSWCARTSCLQVQLAGAPAVQAQLDRAI